MEVSPQAKANEHSGVTKDPCTGAQFKGGKAGDLTHKRPCERLSNPGQICKRAAFLMLIGEGLRAAGRPASLLVLSFEDWRLGAL